MIGTSLSHYRIEELIGQGGMGAVYRAIDTRLGRVVAIKVITAGEAGSRSTRWITRMGLISSSWSWWAAGRSTS
jgi:serine/threonine protein kinase